MRLYLKVTRDEYQLPLMVEDSPIKLAARDGTNAKSVTQMCSKAKRGEIKKPRYIRVEVEDDEEETDTKGKSTTIKEKDTKAEEQTKGEEADTRTAGEETEKREGTHGESILSRSG